MPHCKKQICALLILSLLANFLPAPIGVRQSWAFSVGEEKEVGEKLLSMVRKNFQVLDDPDISQYINDLGQKILTVAGPQYFDYHFFVIKDKEFNAFAAPSGLIFIHSGLIETMESEGELISVMAHECAHVTSRHISDRLAKQTKTSIGTAALLIAGIALGGGGALGQALITGSMAANATMNLKFSREDEEEADRLSFKWMQALRTDPADMESMLRRMHRVSVYRMANIPPYLLTHPEPQQRLGYVQDLIFSANQGQGYQPRDNFPFLRMKHRVLALSRDPATLKAQHLKKAKGKDQQAIMAKYGLALVAQGRADYPQALALMREVIRAFPDRPILQTDLATIVLQSGGQQEALTILKVAHAAAPNEAYTTYTLAQNLEQIGDQQQALQLFHDLLPVIPDHAKLYHTIGNLETRLGKKGVGHYYLGRYFWMEGDVKNARYHLDEVLRVPAMDQVTMTKARDLLADIERIEKEM